MPSPYFDERAHLVVIGDGFLRTPLLSATQSNPNPSDPTVCPILAPEIIHLPSAGRKSGLNLQDPPFRRVVLTSTLCQNITRDRSAVANQSSGVTFKFSDLPNCNSARVMIDNGVTFLGERALIMDANGMSSPRPIDINTVPVGNMTTGWLIFVSRSWQDLRHVEPKLMLKHDIPFQYESEFTTIPFVPGGSFRAFLPIIGGVGPIIAYDARLGPNNSGVITSVSSPTGTVAAVADGIGGYYLDLQLTTFDPDAIPLAIMDANHQVYCRNLIVQETYEVVDTFVYLPHGVVGVPYYCTLPPFPSAFKASDIILPDGLYYNGGDNAIEGTPTEYGSNYGWHGSSIPTTGEISEFGWYLTVNRPPRTLMTISDYEGNDRSTGEYYAIQFMPFGSILTYAGKVYEFRRQISNAKPFPGMVETPYSLGAGPVSSLENENTWRTLIRS